MSGRILVIGGGGFLGRVFCRQLAARAEVVAFDSVARLARLGGLEIARRRYEYGLDEPDVIDCRPGDRAVIFSWRGYPAAHELEPLRHLSLNLEHTLALAASLIRRGIGRIVYASTGGAVYGHCG